MNRYIMKIIFILIIIPSLFIIKCDGKNTLLKGNNKKDKGDDNDKAKKYDVPEQTKTSTSDDGLILRPRLQCQELCRIECSKRWNYVKACYDIHWGCLTGCATACTKGNTADKCREKCEDSFDHRCDSLGCIQGCELGSGNEYRYVPKDLASNDNDGDDDDDTDDTDNQVQKQTS